MKKFIVILCAVLCVVAVAYSLLPYYARQALVHFMPDIDDLYLFERDTVHAPGVCWDWEFSAAYNSYSLDACDSAYMADMETVSFLVIKDDSIVFEKYYGGWNDTLTSNIYSCTKSIVGLLAGIAIDDGKIRSVDDPVAVYLPEWKAGREKGVTIRDLLTMSAGLDWDESYASLFSVTTRGYYGNDLYDFCTKLDVTDEPGVQYSYRSGETQLLAFAIEAATGTTLSRYAEEKLWHPMLAGQNAYWLLDRDGGDEKAFCCFHTTARDAARFARLMLRKGDWNGQRLVSERYMTEAMTPASYLKDQWGEGPLTYYGFQTWIMHYRNQVNPYFRGMLGQYIIAIPSENAIVVRFGHKRSDVYDKEMTLDIYRYMDIAMKVLDTCG